ncbi:unnamed protein product [Clavelina lepadiformis]|uniref:Phosphotransferase n=1 Tax=Clavelina lepadiformis TaxID=159417 RepID=A0ABP0FP03_CLALP
MAPNNEGQAEGSTTLFKSIKQQLHLDNEQLKQVMGTMQSEMVEGLCRSDSTSSLGMLPSYVSSVPCGDERGCYLALDLGGTNFRVLLIKILDETNDSKKCRVEMANQIFSLPESIIQGDSEGFFGYIAECIAMFCEEHGLMDSYLPVGFTFSFPLEQRGLNQGVLLTWTKGFDVSGVKGQDVVQLLTAAINKRGDMNCEVVAIVNDTVGTMMSCALTEPHCKIGLIVGTGCNACYMEKLSNVHMVDGEHGDMCINMELGGFGDNGVLDEIRTEFDKAVDSDSLNPDCHLFEKMISGMYLGELVRLILCKLTKEGAIFNGEGSKKLFTPGMFKTAYVSEIEYKSVDDKLHGNILIRNILQELGLTPDDADCEAVHNVCHLVSKRAAHLCAAGVAAVALKVKENHDTESMKVTVGVDGTVYRKHPTFSKLMSQKVEELCDGTGVSIDFVLSHDGSGKGAALVAAAMSEKVC